MFTYLFTHAPLAFFIQSFWRDEAFSYILAKKNLLQIIFLTARDFNPPLYYFVLHFWMKFFGGSEVIMRSLSLIFYVLTLYILYDFMREVMRFSKYKTLVYLLFFLLNPVLVYYAFEARMYSMLAFFATSSFYFFITKKNGRLYILTSILGLYTHYFMIFVLLSQLCYLFLTTKINKNISAKLKPLFISILAFLPWILFVLLQKEDIGGAFWILPGSIKEIVAFPLVFFTGYEKEFGHFSNLYLFFSLALTVLTVIGILKFFRKKIFLYLLIWTFFPPAVAAGISFFKPIILTRYLIFSTVGFNLLIIYTLSNIKVIPRILFFLGIFLFIFFYQNANIKFREKTNLAAKIREIKKLAKPADVLYVTSQLDFFTAEYYFGENRVFIFNKTYEEIPSYVGKILIPKEKVINTLPIYPKKAFVLKSDGDYDIIARY